MIKYLFVYCLMFCFAVNAKALPSAIGFNADDGTGDTNAVKGYARCDVDIQYYTGSDGVAPGLCHRWGLVWLIGELVKQNEWLPSGAVTTPTVDTDARLPTIKELIRLYDYSGNGFNSVRPDGPYTTILGESISKAIEGKGVARKRWLLSSSYRDVDGDYDVGGTEGLIYGRLQIMALNIDSGEVRAFEPGHKHDLTDGLHLCTAFDGGQECIFESGHTFFYLLVDRTLLKDK